MAPPSKGARKPPVIRPAIPLPHVKRQAAAAAAKNKAASQPQTGAQGVTSPQQRSPSTAKSSISEATSPTSFQPNAAAKSSVAMANGQTPLEEGASKPRPLIVSPKPTTAKPDLDVNGHRSYDNIDRTPKPSQPAAPVEVESRQEPPKEHASKPSVSIPAGQPMRQMPPAFQPASRPESVGRNANMPSRPPIVNGHPHMHRPHPSNGNVHFGAFHDSTGSSPAPPHSGGMAPPPNMPLPDARQWWMPLPGHGYHPNMPPNLDMAAANNYEAYGRPDLAYSHLDPYGHYANSFPPSTPQSFHEASRSVHQDDGGPFNPTGSSTPHHPPPGFGEPSHHPGARMVDFTAGLGDQPQAHRRDVTQNSNTFDWPAYHRDFFHSRELADCTIELRDRSQRTLLEAPGHRIILGQSPVLRDMIRRQPQSPDGSRLVLQIADDWADPSAFHPALQALYGHPLLPLNPPMEHEISNYTAAGTAAERFRYALAYTACGALLGHGEVVLHGCSMATYLISNETAETALEFALDGHEDWGTQDYFKWGKGSRMLLNSLLGFILTSLPADFAFDPSGLGSPYTRLPYDVPSPAQSNTETTSPVIVRANTNGHNRGSLSQNAHIQFGDLSISNGNGYNTQQQSDALRGALSRIIVNLPFHCLKKLFEVPLGNIQIDGATKLRIVQDAVAEREARRHRAIQAIESGRIPDAAQIRARLCTVEPSNNGPWTVLGWEETVSYVADHWVLERQWKPLRDESQVSTAAYP